MPSEISTVNLIQSLQSAPAEEVPSIGAPQLQQRIVALVVGIDSIRPIATGASMSIDIENDDRRMKNINNE